MAISLSSYKDIKSELLPKIYHLDNKWFSWIPTNLGDLLFELMSSEKTLEKFQFAHKNNFNKYLHTVNFKPNISDTISVDPADIFLTLPNQAKIITSVSLTLKNDLYSGNCSISFMNDAYYKKILKSFSAYKQKLKNFMKPEDIFSLNEKQSEEYKNILNFKEQNRKLKDILSSQKMYASIDCKFSFDSEGKIEIDGISINTIEFDSNELLKKISHSAVLEFNLKYKSVLNTVKLNSVNHLLEHKNIMVQALFTVIKRATHKDNHHHQKIDTIIPVNEKLFSQKKILQSIAKNMKYLEAKIKLSTQESKNGEASEIEGLMTYARTFFDNHCTYSEKKIISGMEEVLKSALARDKKRRTFPDLRQSINQSVVAAFGWLISAVILMNGMLGVFLSLEEEKLGKASEFFKNQADIYIHNPFAYKGMHIILFCFVVIALLAPLFRHGWSVSERTFGIDRLATIQGSKIHVIKYSFIIILAIVCLLIISLVSIPGLIKYL